jgi:hypothetical protein
MPAYVPRYLLPAGMTDKLGEEAYLQISPPPEKEVQDVIRNKFAGRNIFNMVQPRKLL